jgi:hypothetical protein
MLEKHSKSRKWASGRVVATAAAALEPEPMLRLPRPVT